MATAENQTAATVRKRKPPDIFDRQRIADLERIVAALVANQRAMLTADYRLLRGTTAEEAMRRLDEAEGRDDGAAL